MTLEIAFMLGLVGVALVLFAFEVFPLEVTALGILGALLASGVIDAEQAVAGLSNKAVVTVGAMLVLSHALAKTGVLGVVADRVSRAAGPRSWLGIAVLLATAGLLSGFLNNTAVVAIFIPLAADLCRRLQVSPSRVLMPLSYVSISGGTLTLIGTSTTLLVSAIAEEHGLEPIGMFEFTPLGAVLLAVGLAYVLTAPRWLLPARSEVDTLTRQYRIYPYLTEVQVSPGSTLIGKTLEEAEIGRLYDISVLAVVRDSRTITGNLRHEALEEEDHLIVRGTVDDLMRLRREQGVALLSDVKLSDEDLSEEGRSLVEALVAPNSRLIGKTLAQFDFQRRLGAFVLGIRRKGTILYRKIAHIPLRFADDLLLVTPSEQLGRLRRSEDVIILSERSHETRTGGRSWVVFLVLPAVVLTAAVGVLDIVESAVLGVIVLFLVGAVHPREAYAAVDWQVLALIAAFVPVGHAMEETGAAGFLADGILRLQLYGPEIFTPAVMVGAVYLLTSLLTQTISNNATAILVAPIGIRLAADLGVDPRPFIVAVAFAASAEFMTPHGYQTNLMVYGPGDYRFLDYTRFGAPLNLAFWVLASLLIPVLWPL